MLPLHREPNNKSKRLQAKFNHFSIRNCKDTRIPGNQRAVHARLAATGVREGSWRETRAPAGGARPTAPPLGQRAGGALRGHRRAGRGHRPRCGLPQLVADADNGGNGDRQGRADADDGGRRGGADADHGGRRLDADLNGDRRGSADADADADHGGRRGGADAVHGGRRGTADHGARRRGSGVFGVCSHWKGEGDRGSAHGEDRKGRVSRRDGGFQV